MHKSNTKKQYGDLMETEEKKHIDEVVGGPYMFSLKDGTRLGLGEWTIGAEKWAKANYESMQNLFNTLMAIDVDDSEVIDAAVRVAIYKLTPESRQQLEDRLRDGQTIEEFFEENITYKNLAELCRAEFEMIKDSIPLQAIEDVKKNHLNQINQMIETQGAGARQKKKTKKKTTRRKSKTR